jgi:serine/threonine protein kinase
MVGFMALMQKKGYIHRDIKPSNVLLGRERRSEFKLADFGFATKLSCYSMQHIVGTIAYFSPKLLVNSKDNRVPFPGNNTKDDVYSLGKTYYQLMTL